MIYWHEIWTTSSWLRKHGSKFKKSSSITTKPRLSLLKNFQKHNPFIMLIFWRLLSDTQRSTRLTFRCRSTTDREQIGNPIGLWSSRWRWYCRCPNQSKLPNMDRCTQNDESKQERLTWRLCSNRNIVLLNSQAPLGNDRKSSDTQPSRGSIRSMYPNG